MRVPAWSQQKSLEFIVEAQGGRSPLQHALALAARGAAVFPCNQTKSPRLARGFKGASTDPTVIAAMPWTDALVGFATGAASGIDVLDLDSPEAELADLPETFTYATRRLSGRHLWLRHAEGMRCSASRLAEGVDVRADGGYAIAWFCHGYPVLCTAEPVNWPDEMLVCAMRSSNKASHGPFVSQPSHINKDAACIVCRLTFAEVREIDRYIDRIRRAPAGTRNTTLNEQSFYMAKFLRRGLRREIAVGLLMQAARLCGLAADEAARTIRSGLDAGLERGGHHNR
jgi:hypothetical protein